MIDAQYSRFVSCPASCFLLIADRIFIAVVCQFDNIVFSYLMVPHAIIICELNKLSPVVSFLSWLLWIRQMVILCRLFSIGPDSITELIILAMYIGRGASRITSQDTISK
jgi:hypothetical protein